MKMHILSLFFRAFSFSLKISYLDSLLLLINILQSIIQYIIYLFVCLVMMITYHHNYALSHSFDGLYGTINLSFALVVRYT